MDNSKQPIEVWLRAQAEVIKQHGTVANYDGEYHRRMNEAAAQLTTLTAKLEAAEKDAARYRWLRSLPIRNERNNGGEIHFTFAVAREEPNQWCIDSKRGPDMDAAIDAALHKTGRSGEWILLNDCGKVRFRPTATS